MEKFTKANAYAFLKELVRELLETNENGALTYGSIEEIKEEFLVQIKDNFEPQAGGGASKNPSYRDEETGVMMHYCRFKQEFRPESEMNMFQGKSKGASKLAAKHAYEIGKEVKELRASALSNFTSGKFTEGAEFSTQADELEATIKVASTFDDENLAYLVAVNAEDEASDEAVDTDGEES